MSDLARKLRELADQIESAEHDTEALPVYPTLPGYPWVPSYPTAPTPTVIPWVPVYPADSTPMVTPPHCCKCGRVFPVITWAGTTTVTSRADHDCDH